jgi:hypothetical protein
MEITAITWKYAAIAKWHRACFNQDLPYRLIECDGEFVLADSQGKPLAPINNPSDLHELIIVACAECALHSPCTRLCIACGKHLENCCQCRTGGRKDTREMPTLPRE